MQVSVGSPHVSLPERLTPIQSDIVDGTEPKHITIPGDHPGTACGNGSDPGSIDGGVHQIELLRAAFEAMGRGYLIIDDEMRISGFNRKFSQLVRLPDGVVHAGMLLCDLMRTVVDQGILARHIAEEVLEPFRSALGRREHGSLRCGFDDGEILEITFVPFGAVGWLVTNKNITARIGTEVALTVQNERFDAAMKNIPHGVCMFDANKRLILCNAGYQELYRLPSHLTLAGTPLREILDFRASIGNSPVEMATYFDVADEAKAAKSARARRIELQDGRTVRIAHNPMNNGGYVATHEDITEAVRAERQIWFLASHDGLTQLPNRTHLRERIGEAIVRTRRGSKFALHYLDLDNFKSVNDTQGHQIGDVLLKQAAERLRNCLVEADILARVGGDEFVVLQSDVEDVKQADNLARRLVEAMSEPFDLDGRLAYLSVSIGITVCPGDGFEPDGLLKNADLAMYRSKSEGRNTYRFFELAMDARLQERRILEMDLRRALVNGEFELYYQPQVDARTEVVTGCEALVRWNHPSRGLVAPAAFIPIAEETGLIVPLGAWVIQQACRDAASWPTHVGVAVNLSSAQFKGLSLVQTVTAALAESGLNPRRLELEITETALLLENENTISTLTMLRILGVRIALDDFGTGYSSLSYLRSFPFDKIKIDRSFVQDLGTKDDCLAIVRAVASLGAALGMATTAEGVETVEQLQYIRAQGCTEVQGYFFGRPVPVSRLHPFFGASKEAAAPPNRRA